MPRRFFLAPRMAGLCWSLCAAAPAWAGDGATATTAGAGERAHSDPSLRLTWAAPLGCPSGEEVQAATLRLASGPRTTEGSLEASALVDRTRENGWRVRLRTRRGAATGEREIEATTCEGVADATALVLALALVPPGSEATNSAAPAAPIALGVEEGVTPGGATARVSTRANPDEVTRSRPTRERGPALALGASVATDASSMPAAAVGGALSLAWTPGRLRLEADGRRWASQSRGVAASNAGARFTMTSLGGRGCWAALHTSSLDLAPCAGADVHLVEAPGYGADANYAATAQWVTITGGALATVPLTAWLGVRARLEAFVPLARPTFVVEGEGIVHRPPTLGAAVSLGVEVRFL